MDIPDRVNACVQHLNEVTGLHLSLDADHATQFDYLGRPVLLRFLSEFDVCVVHAQLDALSESALPAALGDLLEANFMLSNTHGGALSWSQETRMVALNFFLPLAGEDSQAFINRLNRILSVTDQWTQRIRQMNGQATESAAKHLASLRDGTVADHLDMLQDMQMLRA